MKESKIYKKLNEAQYYLKEADFNHIINHLIQVEKWSYINAKNACDQYKNYLYLQKKYGHHMDLPPSREIDEVWNTHILFTKNYINFCEEFFGKYLNHHNQHDKDKLQARKIIYENFKKNTQQLYYNEFGTYLYNIKKYPILTELKRIIYKYFFNSKIIKKASELK